MIIKNDPDIIRGYCTDYSGLRGGYADAVCLPESEPDLITFLQHATAEQTPITISGAGTGVTGGRVPFGGILLSLEHFNHIGPVVPHANGTAHIRVGAAARIADIKKTAAAAHFLYAPDPTEQSATIGGNIATNASGSRGFYFGSTRRYVNALRIVLPTGTVLQLMRGTTFAHGNELTLTAVDNTTITLTLPDYVLPEIKNAAGYFNTPGMDAIDLFIGCEGTLGVIIEAELLLLPEILPPVSTVAFFATADDAWQCAEALRTSTTNPHITTLTIEYFDRFALELLAPEYARIPEKAQAALYIEQVAHKTSDDTVLEFIDTIIEEFRTIPFSTWIADTDKDREYIREFRHRLPEKVNELVSRNGQPKVGTDLAVPQKHFKEMMQRYVTVLGSTELPYLIFGHIGECHMHANILPATNEQCASAKAAYSILVDHALSLGGTVSAEHGIGKTKHSFLKQMLKEHGIAELARIRAIFDPAGILNPGNLYPAKQ